MRPDADDVTRYADVYFNKTKGIIGRFGEMDGTYAVFMRRPVISAPRLMIDWLTQAAERRGVAFDIDLRHPEGDWVGAGDPILYITGPLYHLVDLETVYLQKLGAPCVAAYNAHSMCTDLPKAAFLAMDARHCAGLDMAEMMAYAASVGSAAAQRDADAVGLVANATDAAAHYFGQDAGRGTMPHVLIGYAGSTLRAAEMYVETFPDDNMTVLVDYYGMEISDSLAVCQRYPELAADGRLSFRLDTHSGRYAEGLDLSESYTVLDRHAPDSIRRYRTDAELRYLVGTGVTAASIWHLREHLDREGFENARIVASSGFNPAKCHVMSIAHAPIDVVGTGSYLTENWAETSAIADIIAYDGKPSVKVGREFLLPKSQE
jgi:nicotinate phosphoribosyltransferase